MIWKDEWYCTPYTQELSLDDIDSMRWMKKTYWDDKEAWGCFKNRQQEDKPQKKADETKYRGMNNSGAREVTSTSTCHSEPLHLPCAPCRVSHHHRGWQRAALCGGCSSRIDSLQTTPCCKVRHVPRCYAQSPAGKKLHVVQMPHLAIDHKEHVWLERTWLVYSFRYAVTPQMSLLLVLWRGPGSAMWVTRVGVPSKLDHILNRKIEMKPDIVMHASTVTATCKTEP